jgi:hypothetical protein
MPNNRAAVALDPMPPAEEILAAKAAGMTLIEWRARNSGTGAQKRPRPVASPVSLGTLPFDEPRPIEGVVIVLPWSSLVTDNNRQAWVGTRMMTTKEYKLAKQRAVDAIETQIGDTLPSDLLAAGWQPLFASPVAITVMLFEPNRSAKRDLLNYQKLICDAMTGIVYADDSLIDDAHFTRGAPDIDRPRAEITVTPIGAPR